MHKEEDTSPGSTYDTYSDYASSTICYLTIEMGYESILVIIDDFTKFVQAYKTKNQKAVTMVKLVLDFIRRYGFPEKLHSHQGHNFVGKVMKNLYRLAGISVRF